eukprot:2358808-Pyramimonas_sp.AAC.1
MKLDELVFGRAWAEPAQALGHKSTRHNSMARLVCICICIALLQQVSSTPSHEEAFETGIAPWIPDSSALEDDSLFVRLVEKLAAEPISPDQKAALLHKFEQADEDTKVLIYTSVQMEQTEPIKRCAACEAAIAEVQV